MARRRAPGRTARPSRSLIRHEPTPQAPWPNLEALLDEGGNLSLGQIAPIPYAAVAADGSTMLVALVRQPDESFIDLLNRLDRALAEVNATGAAIDDINT